MATTWEDWLRAAARPPSDHEDEKRRRTETQVRAALSSLQGAFPHRVYAKGSYANNTNVRLNYDVDIAVEYTGTFRYERYFEAADARPSDLGIDPAANPVASSTWRAAVSSALVHTFGSSALSEGRIAFRLREGQTTLPADVVPCRSFKRYDSLSQPPHDGSIVCARDGGEVVNFPDQHLARGNTKNLATGRRFKRMVRCLKRLQTLLVKEGALKSALPSYLVECAVFNVPTPDFGNPTFMGDMRNVLAELHNATRPGGGAEEWEQVNGLLWLFKGQPWKPADVHGLADAAWDHLGFQ